jgi:ATP-dependent DNA ligase
MRSSLTDIALWLARIQRGNALVAERKPFTEQFPSISRACERLPLDTPLDGEILALDENGRTSFNLLQHHHPKSQNAINERSVSLINLINFCPGSDIESPRRRRRAGFLRCRRDRRWCGRL